MVRKGKGGARYIRPAFKTRAGRAHERSTGHKVRTFVGIYDNAKYPIKIHITECKNKNCGWWDEEF